jgi:hypothetical protein
MNKLITSPGLLLAILYIAAILATYFQWKENEKNIALFIMTAVMWTLIFACTALLFAIM